MATPYEPITTESWVCRTCRRPLDGYERRDPDGTIIEFRWQHTFQDIAKGTNHDADPIRLADSGNEIVGTCDFCSQPGCTWTYPCESFRVGTYGSVGNWAACDTCHRAITRNDWNSITKRAVAHHPPAMQPAARTWVRQIHTEFRRHRQGPPTPTH
jgi:hypothetical protein